MARQSCRFSLGQLRVEASLSLDLAVNKVYNLGMDEDPFFDPLEEEFEDWLFEEDLPGDWDPPGEEEDWEDPDEGVLRGTGWGRP